MPRFTRTRSGTGWEGRVTPTTPSSPAATVITAAVTPVEANMERVYGLPAVMASQAATYCGRDG